MMAVKSDQIVLEAFCSRPKHELNCHFQLIQMNLLLGDMKLNLLRHYVRQSLPNLKKKMKYLPGILVSPGL